MEILENGPFIIKVVLRYEGDPKGPPVLYRMNPRLEVPRSWGSPRGGILLGIVDGFISLRPGEEVSTTKCIHNYFSAIPSGKARVTIAWDVYEESKDWGKAVNRNPGTAKDHSPPSTGSGVQAGYTLSWDIETPPSSTRLLATPSVALEVTVPNATRENVDAFIARLDRRVSLFWDRSVPPGPIDRDGYDIIDCLDGLSHPPCASVARRLIEKSPAGFCDSRLLNVIGHCSERPSVAEAHFLALIVNHQIELNKDLIWFLKSHDSILSTKGLETLEQSPDLWTRILTYSAFGRRCNPRWKDAQVALLDELCRSEAGPELSQLFRDLDADDFKRREEASERLASFGPFAEGPLRKTLDSPSPPEARRRLRLLLDLIDATNRTHPWDQIMRSFARLKTPESLTVLKTLAASPWDTPLVKAARATWKEEQRESLPPRATSASPDVRKNP